MIGRARITRLGWGEAFGGEWIELVGWNLAAKQIDKKRKMKVNLGSGEWPTMSLASWSLYALSCHMPAGLYILVLPGVWYGDDRTVDLELLLSSRSHGPSSQPPHPPAPVCVTSDLVIHHRQ